MQHVVNRKSADQAMDSACLCAHQAQQMRISERGLTELSIHSARIQTRARALHHICAYSQGGCSTKVAFLLLNMLPMSESAYIRHWIRIFANIASLHN